MLSRWLWGGRSVLAYATAATLIGMVGGLCIGLSAAYRRDWVDGVLMRGTDLVLAFPPLLLFLLVLVTFGNGALPLVVSIGVYHAIRVSRLVRAAAREILVLPYIEASQARGDPALHILVREVLPNILSPVLIDAGFRLVYSVIIIASLSFLGFGIQPPAADWGLMVAENRAGLQLNLWSTLLPAITIALLSVGVNLVADAKARSAGRVRVRRGWSSERGRCGGRGAGARAARRALGIEVRDLRVDHVASRQPIVEDVSFAVAPGSVLGIVGESGQRQDDRGDGAARLRAAGRPHRRRPGGHRGYRHRRALERRAPPPPRPHDLVRRPGPRGLAGPVDADRAADARAARDALRPARGAAEPDRGLPRAGRAADRRRVPSPLSASAQRRADPARAARHGARR